MGCGETLTEPFGWIVFDDKSSFDITHSQTIDCWWTILILDHGKKQILFNLESYGANCSNGHLKVHIITQNAFALLLS